VKGGTVMTDLEKAKKRLESIVGRGKTYSRLINKLANQQLAVRASEVQYWAAELRKEIPDYCPLASRMESYAADLRRQTGEGTHE
jgi:hypothetical protein